MPLQGEYAEPLPGWQADQIAEILRTGDTRSVDVMDRHVVLFTFRGAKSGLLRRLPLELQSRNEPCSIIHRRGTSLSPLAALALEHLRQQQDALLEDA